ncbi:MAG: Calx-beta domain-containing protein [Marinicella sp.]
MKTLLNILLLTTLLPAFAATVPTQPPFVVGSYQRFNNTNEVVAIDANLINGDYVVCWAQSSNGRIDCSLRNSSDVEIQAIEFPAGSADGRNLDVAFSNDGHFYVMWSTEFEARVLRYNSQGVQVTSPHNIIQAFDTVSMAVTPSGYWIYGTTQTINPYGNYGARYDELGNLLEELNLLDINSSPNNCGANLTSNRSGDLLLSWVERTPENNPECRGNVVGRTFRESGSALGDFISISGNSNPAYYGNLESIADESGEFVIVWDEDDPQWQPPQNPVSCPACNFSYVSRITTFNGGTPLPAQQVLEGINPRIAAGDSGKDFAVIADQPFPLSCENISRWALRGELQPEVIFDAVSCDRYFMNLELIDQETMMLVYSTENNGQVDIMARRYLRPVEIEVGDVSIIEGNPASGQGPSALLSIGLSKPHPGDEQVLVNYFTRDITAFQGQDYTLVTGTATFEAGEILSEILVPILPDTEFETTETFSFNLELADNAVIRDNKGIVSIINDDNSPPVLNNCDHVGDLCKNETEPNDGQSSLVEIILTIDEPQALDIGFSYATRDGSATAGDDYLAAGGSIQIAAGATQTSLFVTLLGDFVNEGTETFDILFSTTSQIDIVEPVITIGITDGTTCQAELDPVGHNVPLAGDSFSFNIETLPDCQWNLTTDQSWIQITSPLTGIGPSTVNYTVDARVNPEVQSRFGVIDVNLDSPISTVTHTVIQDGDPSLCEYSIDQTQFNYDQGFNSGSFHVSALDECAWEVFSDVEWLTITSPLSPAAGDGVVEFEVTPNVNGNNVETLLRSTALDTPFGPNNPINISQAGCQFDLSIDEVTISDLANASVATTVLAPGEEPSACPWTAQSQVSWILVTAGNSGQGGGGVVMNVLENPSVTQRVGTVKIGDEIFTVTQDGQPCIYDIVTDQLNVCPGGTLDQLGILATAGCSWNLTTDQSWVQIDSNLKGVGDEISELSVAANDSESNRSATLTLNSADMSTQLHKPIAQQGYLRYQDFTGSGVPVEYMFTAGDWQVDENQLMVNMNGLGEAFAFDASETAYCSDCKVEGDVKLNTFSSSSQQNIGLVGWFQSPNSYISLTMDEFLNQWRLNLVKNGQLTFAVTNATSLIPSQVYRLAISYDDQFIYGHINGKMMVQLSHGLVDAPAGYPGFYIHNSNGSFDDLSVSGSSADSDLIFAQSFESIDFVVPSICSQQ